MIDRVARKLAPSICTALCIAATLASPLDARAGKFDETLDFSIHSNFSAFRPGSIGLRTLGKGPALLSDAHLSGRARALAPMLRANFTLHGWRFGVGAGFEGYTGLRLDHEPLPLASKVTDGRVWGIPIEAFVGYAFLSRERVRPFIEARTTATFIQARARLAHGDDDGHETIMRMRTTAIGVAARAGVLVHLNEYFFLDAGVGRVLNGAGAWTASVGIGIPIPLSNL